MKVEADSDAEKGQQATDLAAKVTAVGVVPAAAPSNRARSICKRPALVDALMKGKVRRLRLVWLIANKQGERKESKTKQSKGACQQNKNPKQ